MKCPIDGTTLLMTTRSGIEIDYCPECRGIWLDRGELDKIIEREATQAQPFQAQAPVPQPQQQQPYYQGGSSDDYYKKQKYGDKYDPYYHKKKKKSSMLGDLFDF